MRSAGQLTPEGVAYWYLRLNGFFQMDNFVVHPTRSGGQRTDADLIAVRFPHRAERLFDDPDDVMGDDERRLALTRERIDVVIAEVKTNQPCSLNGPWTDHDLRNVHRVLAAIGCLPSDHIEEAAADIYKAGIHISKFGVGIRLVAVGRDRSEQLSATFPDVAQLTWTPMLAFVWNRLHHYRRQKTQVDQWNAQGQMLKQLADRSATEDEFIAEALSRMGVRSEAVP